MDTEFGIEKPNPVSLEKKIRKKSSICCQLISPKSGKGK